MRRRKEKCKLSPATPNTLIGLHRNIFEKIFIIRCGCLEGKRKHIISQNGFSQ